MKTDTHSFIVRIWSENQVKYSSSEDVLISGSILEGTAPDSSGALESPQVSPADLRGMIEHVGSSKRLYFYNLDGITRFIQEELELNKKPLAWLHRFKHSIMTFLQKVKSI